MKKLPVALSSALFFAVWGILPVIADSVWFEGETQNNSVMTQPFAEDLVDIVPDSPVVIDQDTLSELTRLARQPEKQQVETQLHEEQLAERLTPPTPEKIKFLKSSDFALVHYQTPHQVNRNTKANSNANNTVNNVSNRNARTNSDNERIANAETGQRRMDGRSTRVETRVNSGQKTVVEPLVETIDPADEHLSPQVRQLKQQIRATLATNARRQLTLQNNTPADLIAFSNAFGAETLVIPFAQASGKGNPQPGTPIYAIGSLCWNYPSSGRTLLRTNGKQIIPRVGAGLQKKQATLLAMLAMSSIAENYEIKVDNNSYTVADLVAFEKSSCSRGLDLSLALVALSFYCDCNEEWKNEFGEVWSLSRMVKEELARPVDQGNVGITDQLLGLSSVVQRFENEGEKLDRTMLDAKQYLDSYCDFIMTAQNDQGLWHPRFFLYKGVGDSRAMLYSSGNIVRFLVYHLPQDKLSDPQVVRSVLAVLATLNKLGNAPLTTEREHEMYGTTLQALAMYAEKVSQK